MAKKDQATAVADVEELDEIEETAEASAEAAPKKGKAKAEKPARVGSTTKEFAGELGITPVRLRRILRSMEQFADNTYTRYDLTADQMAAVREFIKNGEAASAEKKAARAAAKASASAESASEDAGEELEDLEDSDEDSEEDEEEENEE